MSLAAQEAQDLTFEMGLTDALLGVQSKVSERAARAPRPGMPASGGSGSIPPPASSEYTAAELEFMQAIQAYKQSSGRMFPTWSEILEVLQGLGYEKSV